MSLYGALYAGVSALGAQSQAMGMISDNIANVNTIGYKRTEAAFESLVTAQGRSTAYAPGAVRANTLQRIDQQGIIQQSRSSTDIAISGNGFFVVQNSAEGSQESFYTRSGAFSEDSQGYLVNPASKYLMGWPLDAEGNLPSGSADVSSLQPVNVAFLGGVTRPTTTAEMVFNLNATETPYTYPLTGTETAHFTRSLRVYDSLGEAQDITFSVRHHTSPTATMEGSVDMSNITNMFDDINGINSTATMTGTVDINTPADLGTTAGTLSDGDSFVIALNDEVATITMNTTDTAADLVNTINAVFTGTPASINGGGQLEITANTAIEVRVGGSQPASAATLNSLGFDYETTLRDDVTFTLQAGIAAAQTVTIGDGDTPADVIASINSLIGINAQFNADGEIIIATDSSTDDLIVGGVGGAAPQIPAAGFANLGFAIGTYTSPAAPTLLTGALENTANPQNWWEITISDTNGLELTRGSVNFDGDGSLNSDGDGLISLSGVDWGNGSDTQAIDIDISGFSQYSGNYNVVYTTQNGAELGLRSGISVDREGIVSARFTNGETTALYQIPIATFANGNGLISQNGNIYQESTDSGSYNLREAGQGGAGLVEGGSLESSNVDLADEFSKMIVTQRAYSAGTKVINTSDQMLEELLRLR